MKLFLSNNSSTPLYEQLKEQIRQGILQGDPAGGGMLPSIRSLAQSLSTSIITVKRAYDDLEQEGYIYTTPGKGTFVSPQSQEQVRRISLEELDRQIEEVVAKAHSLGVSCAELEKTIAEKYGVHQT